MLRKHAYKACNMILLKTLSAVTLGTCLVPTCRGLIVDGDAAKPDPNTYNPREPTTSTTGPLLDMYYPTNQNPKVSGKLFTHRYETLPGARYASDPTVPGLTSHVPIRYPTPHLDHHQHVSVRYERVATTTTSPSEEDRDASEAPPLTYQRVENNPAWWTESHPGQWWYSVETGLCVDATEFRDSQGYTCSAWAGQDCSGHTFFPYYTPVEIDQIRVICPASCDACPGGPHLDGTLATPAEVHHMLDHDHHDDHNNYHDAHDFHHPAVDPEVLEYLEHHNPHWHPETGKWLPGETLGRNATNAGGNATNSPSGAS